MQIITSLDELKLNKDSALAIGKFDGIHLGHKKLLSAILDKKKDGLQTVVFTFNPSPAALFSKVKEKEITSLEEKRIVFANMGVDVLIEFPLTFETAAMSKEEFVEKILVDSLRVKYIAAGTDLSFAKNGEGNSDFLKEKGKELDFIVEIIDKITLNDEIISSTAIRQAISNGNVEKATQMLGTPYFIGGVVEKGRQIGRTIGFPTVNLSVMEDKLLPLNGVYLTKVLVNSREYFAITNVGCKPTVSTEGIIGIESYLYDFEHIIYGEPIKVLFLQFVREERQFCNLIELKKQIESDREYGKTLILKDFS